MWTPKRVLVLRQMYPKARVTPDELLSSFLPLTMDEIHDAAELFDCATEMGSRWTRREFDSVRHLYTTSMTVKEIAAIMGKTESAVRNMAKGQLKVKRPHD